MTDEATRLGMTLAVIAKYSMTTIQCAIEACEAGMATPRQQKVVGEFLRAVCGHA